MRYVPLAIGLLASACASNANDEKPKIRTHRYEGLRAVRTTSTATTAHSTCAPHELQLEEARVPSDGAEVFVQWIESPSPSGAIVLMHGAGSPSSALWDLAVRDYSLLRALACAGYDAYGVDVRGFGGASRPAELLEPADRNDPIVRAKDAIVDLDAAVEFARRTSKVGRVDLLGWSWGAMVSGHYAGTHPENLRRLVLYAPVYDRKWKTRHRAKGAWRAEERALNFKYFDAEREDRDVLEAYVDALFRFTEGDEIRLPNGPYADLYGADAPIWKAGKVTAATLIIRGDADRASLDVHAQRLFSDLTQASSRRYVVIGGGGHFMFRTKKYLEWREVVFAFLDSEAM